MPNAELAGKILDAIAANPESFDMSSWHYSDDGEPLSPDTEPSCGTTLCIAGWAAHLTGWTVDEETAYKPWVGEDRVRRVAALELGIPFDTAFDLFVGLDDDSALAMLREMAGRG